MNIWILSKQQRRCLQLAACGLSLKQTGYHLKISEDAVRSSLNQVYQKLDARRKIDAVFTGIQLGEISELHAYYHVEARQVANCLANNKQPATQSLCPSHDFLIASNNEAPVHYSLSNNPL